MLKISDLTVKNIRKGKFEKELPELYALKGNIENNPWHNQESTFDHTVAVLESLEKIIKTASGEVKQYLKEKVGTQTRQDLLWIATVFHDIAKPQVRQDRDGYSMFPDHEKMGMALTKDILNRVDLNDEEKNFILTIIENHGHLHGIVDPKTPELEERLQDLKQVVEQIYIELVLFSMADSSGCQLPTNDPNLYQFKMNTYQGILDGFLESKTQDDLEKHLELANQKAARALADYQNLERRMQQEKIEWVKYANTNLLTKILDVADNLDRAADFIKDPGLDMVRNNLTSVLKEFGVEEIEALGKPYDPHLMECIDKKEGEENIVLEVSQKGYQLHEKVLRPAKVVVGIKQ